MGTCTICGQKAGLFSGVHKSCEEARTAALATIRQDARDALVGEALALTSDELRAIKLNRDDMAPFRRSLPRIQGFWERCAETMKQGHLSRGLSHNAVVDGWLDAVEVFLTDTMADKWELTAAKAGDAGFGLSSSDERLIEARSLLKLATVRAQISFQELEQIRKCPSTSSPRQENESSGR